MYTLNIDDELELKPFSIQDASAIFDLIDRNRDHLSQHGDDTAGKYLNVESVIESIENPKNPLRERYGICVKKGPVFVGSINITLDSEIAPIKAEIGYYLGSEFTGRGYMSRAVNRIVSHGFENLEMNVLYAMVHPENVPSINVLEKAGFSLTGLDDGNGILS